MEINTHKVILLTASVIVFDVYLQLVKPTRQRILLSAVVPDLHQNVLRVLQSLTLRYCSLCQTACEI